MVEHGVQELKSHKLSNGHAFESDTLDLCLLKDQMQQVKDEEAQLLQVLPELMNNTDENCPCVTAQQEGDLKRFRQELAKEQTDVHSWKLRWMRLLVWKRIVCRP